MKPVEYLSMPNEYTEHPVDFSVEDSDLYGILAVPSNPIGVAVVIVVGGPQFRVGSHRQFVLLARHLAKNGILVLRFDYSGMGYSQGPEKKFYEIDDDIKAAVEFVACKSKKVNKIYLWGLCDAASAIAFSVPKDIDGMVLLNPWVRSETTHSKVLLSSYYKDRLVNIKAWKELLLAPKKIIASFFSLGNLIINIIGPEKNTTKDCVTPENRIKDIASAMQIGLSKNDKSICIILSGNDLTAKEFRQVMQRRGWGLGNGIFSEAKIFEVDLATHTFSSSKWRDEVEKITLEFVCS